MIEAAGSDVCSQPHTPASPVSILPFYVPTQAPRKPGRPHWQEPKTALYAPTMCWPAYVSLPKTPFSLSQLNLNGDSCSLQATCSRSFSCCFLRFGKDSELGPSSKQRSLPSGISF